MVLHVDLNSFFARVEQQANPHLRNRPIGILGKGHKGARTCVCAASPEAKKFGIKSGMSVSEARQLCPQLILVAPDYPKYLDISRRFMHILEEFSPWVEIFSIDEAFIDLKSNKKSEARNPKSRCCDRDPDRSVGTQTNLNSLNPVLNFEFDNLNIVSDFDIRYSNLEIADAFRTASAIKQQLRNELGELITVNIGIAWGKVFAKLAGELQKPDGLVILTPDTWLDKTGHLPVTELCGIGYRIGKYLNTIGIHSIRDLTTISQTLLIAKFGRSTGLRLWEIGQGIDRSPVLSTSLVLGPANSIGHQITLDRDIRWSHLYSMVAKLTKKVGRRLRKSGQATQRVSIHALLAGSKYLVQTNRHQPAISHDHELLRSVRHLYSTTQIADWQRVRRIGVVVSDLSPAADQILPLFPKEFQKTQITASLDKLRDHYGEDSIEWASAFGIEVGNLRDWRGPHAVLDR